jgi:hypothetical protein
MPAQLIHVPQQEANVALARSLLWDGTNRMGIARTQKNTLPLPPVQFKVVPQAVSHCFVLINTWRRW